VVQNVFIELLKDGRKAWARYDPRFRLTTWLGLVVATQVDRATRGRKLQPLEDRMNELAAEVGSAPDAEAVERLRATLSVLSDRERLMVSLYYLDGMGTKEIADTTGVPANTVASHLMRAREKLKKSLQSGDARPETLR
jgi:RNA polymerase sigma-70 factor (ECF subfamily)